jgi:hypothetical protein
MRPGEHGHPRQQQPDEYQRARIHDFAFLLIAIATLSIPDVHPLVGEDPFPGGGYDNWEDRSAGLLRQRLLNHEDFSHIVDKNEGQY